MTKRTSSSAAAAPYATLGLPRYATESEVRRAYKDLALQAHPDKGGDPARFDAVQKAYGAIVAKLEHEKDERKKAFVQLAARKEAARPGGRKPQGIDAENSAGDGPAEDDDVGGSDAGAIPIRQGEDQKVLAASSDLKELGDEALKAGHFERAVEYYNTAAAYARMDCLVQMAELYEARARAQGGLGAWQGSLEDAGRACALRPIWGAAFATKGCALAKMEQWAAAKVAFERALVLDSECEQATDGLAEAEARLVALACAATLTGHSASVSKVAFMPVAPGGGLEGETEPVLLATASADGTARVWKSTGECLRVLEGHGGAVVDLAWSPDGSGLLATASEDGTAKLWEAGSAEGRGTRVECAATLSGHEGPITSVSFDHAGDLLATTSRDCTARVWDSSSGTMVHALRRLHGNTVSAAAFHPTGRALATASDDEDARVWDLAGDVGARGECLHTLRWNSGAVNDVTYTPDGRLIVIATHEPVANKRFYRLLVWSAVSGRLCRWFDGHTGIIAALSWRPSGGGGGMQEEEEEGEGEGALCLATGSWDGTLKLWDITGEPAGPGTFTTEMSANQGSPIQRGHAEVLWSGGIHSAVFSPAGSRIAAGCEDRRVRIYDGGAEECIHDWEGHQGPVRSVAWSPGSGLVASASEDGTARVWAVPLWS